jgi:hypothetical protein
MFVGNVPSLVTVASSNLHTLRHRLPQPTYARTFSSKPPSFEVSCRSGRERLRLMFGEFFGDQSEHVPCEARTPRPLRSGSDCWVELPLFGRTCRG